MNSYGTHDIYHAAWLLYRGKRLLGLEPTERGYQLQFVFDDRRSCLMLIATLKGGPPIANLNLFWDSYKLAQYELNQAKNQA